jgi:hypothetical protein
MRSRSSIDARPPRAVSGASDIRYLQDASGRWNAAHDERHAETLSTRVRSSSQWSPGRSRTETSRLGPCHKLLPRLTASVGANGPGPVFAGHQSGPPLARAQRGHILPEPRTTAALEGAPASTDDPRGRRVRAGTEESGAHCIAIHQRRRPVCVGSASTACRECATRADATTTHALRRQRAKRRRIHHADPLSPTHQSAS